MSALSAEVHRMLHISKEISTKADPHLLTIISSGLVFINWNQLQEQFDLSINNNDFVHALKCLAVESMTILERGLYDLYFLHCLSKTKKSNLILRDLIASKELRSTLHPAAIKLLELLFLPKNLNLRNLVVTIDFSWHGFLTQDEFPTPYATLILVLMTTIFQEEIFHDPFTHHDLDAFKSHENFKPVISIIQEAQLAVFGASISELEEMVSRSSFVPTNHQRQVITALKYFKDGYELLFLFSALPALEHAVRLLFSRVNCVSEIAIAHIDQYFSTLDGFGQRHKHQVLLDGCVFATGESNKMLDLLQTTNINDDSRAENGSLAIFLDLFMMERGPGLRGKLCHGELSLDSLFKTVNSVSVISALLFFSILKLSIERTIKNITAWENQQNRLQYNTIKIPDSDQTSVRIQVDGIAVEYADKDARILPSISNRATLPTLVQHLEKLIDADVLQLERLTGIKETLSNLQPNFPLPEFQAARSLPIGHCLLSIMDLLESASKLNMLLEKVTDRTARSGQRRALYTNIIIFPFVSKLYRYVILWIKEASTSSLLAANLPFPKMLEFLGAFFSFTDGKNTAIFEKCFHAALQFFKGKIGEKFREPFQQL
ncbi:hypothetical protein HK100_004207 [Physocladia obscura]|uniref:DUF4209 domain-containing protein n=1 Tax=Physocladia obscura TaxID=109957 RepID=A0AAD5ST59_9FUNG|nr:hypothetical protein HK100_004207 [Physocladia obscura]